MRRKKPPRDFGPPPPAPPPVVEFPPFPRLGDPAPSIGAFQLPSEAERERREWELAHAAWMRLNGLTCGPEEFRAWFENPLRDRIPMPAVLEWQRRQLARKDLRNTVLGVEPAYWDLDPVARLVRDTADPEIQQLRQARDADAARLRQLESSLSQAAGDFSGIRAEQASLAARTSRLTEIIGEQRAAAEQRDAEIERQRAAASELSEEIARKDAEARTHQSAIGKLESDVQGKDDQVQRKDAVIRRQDATIWELEATTRQLRQQVRDARDRSAKRSAEYQERAGRQQAARIGSLETELRYLQERNGQLETENERLRQRLVRKADAPRRGDARA